MDLNDYFDPVALDKPDGSRGISDSMLGHNIRINTPNTPIDEISNYQLAIMGVAEDRNSANTGSATAADHIRAKLYELYRVNDKLRIIDLGNLRKGATANDTYFGIRDVMTDLLNNQVTAIVLGGTQDITHALYMAFEQQPGKVNLVTVDARIDLEEGPVSSFSWMMPVMKSPKLFRCTCLGNQQYLVDRKHLETLEERGFDSIRLGALRSNISRTEPLLRDAHLVSFDIAAVKQAEAPATRFPSPTGIAAV
jgi:formiminoglutamase